MRFGDQNSKYFHACASQKHRRKNIEVIKDVGGQVCTSKEEIEAAFVNYFSELFTAGSNLDLDGCLGALEEKVTPVMNQKLLAEFNVEEISEAMQQMDHLKAPGLNGFSASFFLQNWTTIHTEVCVAILHSILV